MTEEYTPGYTQTASDFMAQRSAVSHAKFLLPHLDAASRLLDCGCGPGSISCDFAKIVVSGHVRFSATYDCYQSPSLIADYLALKLVDADANALCSWSVDPDAFFAQAWCEVLGTKRG